MPEKPFSHKELVELLGKLKEETPEYPAKLVDARKESFLKQVLDMGASGGGQGGDGGSDSGDEGPKGGSASSAVKSGPGKAGKPAASTGPSSSGGSSRPTGLSGSGGGGGSGAGLSGGATFLGFSLKSVLVFGAVVVLLTAAYLFRDQIGEILAENGIARREETTESPFEASQADQETETPPVVAAPNFNAPSPEIVATATVPNLENNNNSSSPGNGGNVSPTQKPPSQAVSPATTTPTPEQPGGLSGALQFLICILRMGGDSCQ